MGDRSGDKRGISQWLSRRHAQVLNSAYEAAREIRALENQYCQGQPITDDAQIGKTVYDYVRSLCDRKLLTIRNNLTQFKINSFLLGRPLSSRPFSDGADIKSADISPPILDDSLSVESAAKAAATVSNASVTTYESTQESANGVIQRLSFIESVISRYRDPYSLEAPISSPQSSGQLSGRSSGQSSGQIDPDAPLPIDGPSENLSVGGVAKGIDPAVLQFEIAADELARPGLLGSFSLNRKQTAQYEQRVVQELRARQQQSRSALRWLAVLLFVPFLVAVLTKVFFFGPMLGNYSDANPTAVELSTEIREGFTAHLTEFKEELEIRELLHLAPDLAPEVKREKLAEEAADLWREARDEELNGLKNVLADSVALIVFTGLVYFNRRRLEVVRAFSNRAFLTLSDPVKIFLFILVTDMFVGFHSAEGWDAILTGISYHFGLPEHPNAIKIFIATVPVMMDSFIKFWIFNYLTRYSPASSAIFERMNS